MCVRNKVRMHTGWLHSKRKEFRHLCVHLCILNFCCFWFLKGWSALLDDLCPLSPLYTLTTGQPGNTPGAQTLHRNSCTNKFSIAATLSEGHKRKNWRGGHGSKSMWETGARPKALKSWDTLRDCLGAIIFQEGIYITCILCHSPVCKHVDSWIQPKSFWKQKDKIEEKKGTINGIGRKKQSHQICNT